jgi:hypothetical protein
MSVPSNAIAQMLMQGSGGAQPNMQGANGMQTGADLIRKMMMIKALQGQQQQPGMPPAAQPNVLGQIAAQPQAMQSQQMPGGINA